MVKERLCTKCKYNNNGSLKEVIAAYYNDSGNLKQIW